MSKLIRRGDVVMAPFGKEQYLPVVVLSEGIYNQKSGTIIAIPLIRQEPKAGFPLSYKLSKIIEGGQYWARPGQIKTFTTLTLGLVVDHLETHDLKEIVAGLSEIINEPIFA